MVPPNGDISFSTLSSRMSGGVKYAGTDGGADNDRGESTRG